VSYSFYTCDTETTGLDSRLHSPIEISIIRKSDGAQKTWFLKPINMETIDLGALRINGHKLEDLKGETKYGRETYLDPEKVIIEIENWLAEDGVPAETRCMVGQNISFDKEMLEQLWIKLQCRDSFPFGRRYMDTMVIEMFIDYCKNATNEAEGYSLNNLSRKYGVKNEKSHSASADTKCCDEIFDKQIIFFKKILNTHSE